MEKQLQRERNSSRPPLGYVEKISRFAKDEM